MIEEILELHPTTLSSALNYGGVHSRYTTRARTDQGKIEKLSTITILGHHSLLIVNRADHQSTAKARDSELRYFQQL